jgi:regulator of sigma E protease
VGWSSVAIAIAFVALSMFAFNLLPIPVLNGGHILFALWEWATGRPASEVVRTRASCIGLLFSVVLFGRLFYVFFA